VSIAASTLQPSAALFADLPVTIGQVVLFRENAADEAFLRRLYRSTREDELAVTGWPEAQKQLFCDSQFDLQHAHYLRQHPTGEFLVIRAGNEPVGRLYIDVGGDAVHLIDISLLPAWRGRGIGSALLKALQQHAAASGKAVSLHVTIWNQRAMALYRRCGFVTGAADGSHIAMCWTSRDISRFS
jgi:ribosomal protein S18 acetylase RimI-like enzyme